MVSLDLFLSPGLVNGRDGCPSSSGLVSGFVWFVARLLLTVSLDWSPPAHIVQSRSLTKEQKDPVFCSRWRSSLYPNCITPSSITSWVNPALPFHSYTARTKKSQMEGDVDKERLKRHISQSRVIIWIMRQITCENKIDIYETTGTLS